MLENILKENERSWEKPAVMISLQRRASTAQAFVAKALAGAGQSPGQVGALRAPSEAVMSLVL